MALTDALLATAARALYRSSLAHDDSMKAAVRNHAACQDYRHTEVRRVLTTCERFGITLTDRDVLDLGCATGALTVAYAEAGARFVTGVDVDPDLLARARAHARVKYIQSTPDRIPLPDASVDVILSYDVFEHVADPPALLSECRRVLRPAGMVLIGTWGWGHPYAPHLWNTMPVPWAHLLVSERTLLRACRRVYQAPWYSPTMHDLDESGNKHPDKYTVTSIPTTYLNKFSVRDFERAFADSGLAWETHLQPFGSVPWTAPLLSVPFLREYMHGYLWAVLRQNPRLQ